MNLVDFIFKPTLISVVDPVGATAWTNNACFFYIGIIKKGVHEGAYNKWLLRECLSL